MKIKKEEGRNKGEKKKNSNKEKEIRGRGDIIGNRRESRKRKDKKKNIWRGK